MNFGRRIPFLALGHLPGLVGFDERLVLPDDELGHESGCASVHFGIHLDQVLPLLEKVSGLLVDRLGPILGRSHLFTVDPEGKAIVASAEKRSEIRFGRQLDLLSQLDLFSLRIGPPNPFRGDLPWLGQEVGLWLPGRFLEAYPVDFGLDLGRVSSRDLPDRIHELLGRHTLGHGSGIYVVLTWFLA